MKVQFNSVTQSCPTLCDSMTCSTPGLSVHHQLPEFTQTQVHRVGDAIQPSHPLSSPSHPAPNPSQHQGLFQCVNSSHEVAKVLEFLVSILEFAKPFHCFSITLCWQYLGEVELWLLSVFVQKQLKAYSAFLKLPWLVAGKVWAQKELSDSTCVHSWLPLVDERGCGAGFDRNVSRNF